MNLQAVFFMFLCVWINSCKNTSQLTNTHWLEGTWANQTQRGTIYEAWTLQSDQSLTAKSYKINAADTIVLETVRLIQENRTLFYIPQVNNQNKGKPIRFALKSIDQNQMVFENPQHDFPQFITYTKIGKDSLVAEISGKRNGQLQRRSFPMKKTQTP